MLALLPGAVWIRIAVPGLFLICSVGIVAMYSDDIRVPGSGGTASNPPTTPTWVGPRTERCGGGIDAGASGAGGGIRGWMNAGTGGGGTGGGGAGPVEAVRVEAGRVGAGRGVWGRSSVRSE